MSDVPQRIWVWNNAPNGEVVVSGPDHLYPAGSPSYILATPSAIAASPEGKALIREAEARGMELAGNLARRLANDADREARTYDATSNQRTGLHLVRDAAATLEAAIRAAKGEPE